MFLGRDVDLTREVAARRVRHALVRAAVGLPFINSSDRNIWTHQCDGWVRTNVLIPGIRIGRRTCTYAKQYFEDKIEEKQGWMRWVGDPKDVLQEVDLKDDELLAVLVS